MARIYSTGVDEDWQDAPELEASSAVDRCYSARSLRLEVNKEALERSCKSVEETPTEEHSSPSGSSHHLTLPSKPQLRRCRSASPAVVRAQLLSPEQQQLIRKSWQRVSKSAIGKAIYQHMTAKCPETRGVFMSDISTIERHGRYFVDLIQGAVGNLNELEDALRPWLEMIGKGHQGFAINLTLKEPSLGRLRAGYDMCNKRVDWSWAAQKRSCESVDNTFLLHFRPPLFGTREDARKQ